METYIATNEATFDQLPQTNNNALPMTFLPLHLFAEVCDLVCVDLFKFLANSLTHIIYISIWLWDTVIH